MPLDRRQFLIASAGTAAAGALGLASDRPAVAKAPLATVQAPAYYRFKIGAVEITAIMDGMLELPLSLFSSADKAQAEAMLSKLRRTDTAPTPINAYVVNSGDKLFLVDTGYGNMAGPDSGSLLGNLKFAGFEPDQFDAVILTHLHPDHIGGLLDQQGRPVFRNATLLVRDAEYAFWTDEGIMSRSPADSQKFFKIAQAGMKPYGTRMQQFKDGEELASGISCVAAPGHTPGHSMIHISSGKDTFLIWGDIVHVAALQFSKPEWAISFDTDQAQAVETRKKIYDRVAADGTLVAGMHLDFPGLGHVWREPNGYSFQRAVWSNRL